MVVAGFILCYRKQWPQIWIVSWVVVLGVLVGVPILWNLIPALIREPFETKFISAIERVSPVAAYKRVAAKKRAAAVTRQSSGDSVVVKSA